MLDCRVASISFCPAHTYHGTPNRSAAASIASHCSGGTPSCLRGVLCLPDRLFGLVIDKYLDRYRARCQMLFAMHPDAAAIGPKRGASVGAKATSKQDYGTPPEFIAACIKRFGPLAYDLAANDDGSNSVAPKWLGPTDNSLRFQWAELPGDRPLLWLNPPFADIDPWAEKCAWEADSGVRILLLTPASIDTNWFAKHVLGKALVLGINPRLQFAGTTAPYPKALMLSCFGFGVHGFDQWRWRP